MDPVFALFPVRLPKRLDPVFALFPVRFERSPVPVFALFPVRFSKRLDPAVLVVLLAISETRFDPVLVTPLVRFLAALVVLFARVLPAVVAA